MGLWKRFFAADVEPDEVVLVPPIWERDFKGRSRFAKSGYDYAFFGVPQRILHEYYLNSDARSMMHFSPAEDPRVSLTARGGSSLKPGLIGTDAAGSLNLRFQPKPRDPVTFADLKCSTQEGGGARFRGCYFSPEKGVGGFAVLPLVAADPSRRGERAIKDGLQSDTGCQELDTRLGLRYSTPNLGVGISFAPASANPAIPSAFWAVARNGPLTYGWQVRPNADLLLPTLSGAGSHRGSPNGLTVGEAKGLASDVAQCSSFAVSYSPESSQPGKGAFSTIVEFIEGRTLAVSFFSHMITQRHCRNPLENGHVVGITNYLDLALQVVSSLDKSPLGTEAAPNRGSGSLPTSLQQPALRMAAAWQVNKNWLLKLRVGTEGVTAALGLKAWWQPSLTLAASVGFVPGDARPCIGLTANVENYGNIRYERTNMPGKLYGGALVQRHVALPSDLANAKGEGLLVHKKDLDNAEVLGQMAPPSAHFL